MKSAVRNHRGRAAVLTALLLAGAGRLLADSPSPEKAPGSEPWLFIGPRIGTAITFATQSDFNGAVQSFFPSSNVYFPVSSLLGVDLALRFPISGTGFRFSIEQLLAVEGLEQDFALPVYSILFGVEAPFGLVAGLGPELQLTKSTSRLGVGTSLVVAAGWRFTFNSIAIPVVLLFDPLPPDRRIKLSVIAGVDFGFSPQPKRDPFNY